MRFKLILEVCANAFGNVLPVNYQYEQSAVIYRILSQASKQYADWLHENGFRLESGKNFKLFTYSPLKISERKILKEKGRLLIFSQTVEWQISFLPEQSTEKFIQGLFAKQIFEIGDKKSTVQFRVQKIEVVPAPDYKSEMFLEAMSPICLKIKREDGSTEYISPKDTRAKEVILYGLLSRYESFYGKRYQEVPAFDFIPEGECKKKLIKIKVGTKEETGVVGYKCKFTVNAPTELMKILYESGIGEQCSQGFGCVREGKG